MPKQAFTHNEPPLIGAYKIPFHICSNPYHASNKGTPDHRRPNYKSLPESPTPPHHPQNLTTARNRKPKIQNYSATSHIEYLIVYPHTYPPNQILATQHKKPRYPITKKMVIFTVRVYDSFKKAFGNRLVKEGKMSNGVFDPILQQTRQIEMSFGLSA